MWRCRHLGSIHGIYSTISNGFSSDSQKGRQYWWQWGKHGGLKRSTHTAPPLEMLKQTASVTYSIIISQRQFSSLCSFLLRGEHCSVALAPIFQVEKHKGASCFTILNLQLSISRVQFCSSKGYLLRSIMQAAVVVILKQNRTKDGFTVAYVSEMSEVDKAIKQSHNQTIVPFTVPQ